MYVDVGSYMCITVRAPYLGFNSNSIPIIDQPRLGLDLSSKLVSFQKKFDDLLQLQANSLQMDHEPSQSVPQLDSNCGK